jgi:hypothetical protein
VWAGELRPQCILLLGRERFELLTERDDLEQMLPWALTPEDG